ncbi:MAG: purine-nucleoside/S-methyl-5-thioadenosine phosphorylase / adenosine deaminase [Blastocatellia bacterium]|jgi:YfiH family protein|nr:purine-nucleoside/S-methyl-5-thioadenosine phosphorylase / adenosine deaminase [Blastocatellia bacterium]
MPIEMITDEDELKRLGALQDSGFYWRERHSVRALVCAPLEQDGFTNAFSTRLGGVSPMPEAALNLAGFNEDDAENIYENRRRFLQLFEGDWTLAGCWQIHSADVRIVHNQLEAQSKPGVLGDDVYCDALVSGAPKILLAVKTADCVPVLLGDPETGAFAAVHAGWRGTSESIVIKAVAQLQSEYGARPENLRAAIGPAANTCCYEVGSDVIEKFKERFPHSEHLFTPTSAGHARIDLQTANRDQLNAAGVLPERIHVARFCTMDRNDLFFSYRREKSVQGRVGRLMSVIGRRA